MTSLYIEEPRPSGWTLIIPVALASLFFLIYLTILTRHPLIYGIDGAYYLIQVRSIERTGVLRYGDPPLAFYTFWAISRLVGDITLGVKIGVALLTSLAAIPVYLLLKDSTRNVVASTAGTLAYLLSPQYLRLMGDLMKNAVGCLFLMAFIYALHVAVSRRGLRGAPPSLFFLILTGLTHILDFGVALFVLLVYPVLYAVIVRNRAKEAMKVLAFHLVFLSVFVAVAILLFYGYFSDFFKGEAFIEELIYSQPEWGQRFPLVLLSPMQTLTLPLLASGLVLAVYLLVRKDEASPLLLTAIIVGLALILPFIPAKWLWRFALMTFIPASIILALLVDRAGGHSVGAAALSVLLLLAMIPQFLGMAAHIRPCISMAEYHDLKNMRPLVEQESIVIAPWRLRYWTEYILDRPVSRQFTPELWSQYKHVYLVSWRVAESPGKPPPMPGHPGEIPPGPPKAPHREVYVGVSLVLYELLPPPPKP